jgi:hypothetical protein
MTGKERREKMDSAIKEIILPFLKDKGFKGSYPHFRRERGDKLNLLCFQFSLYSSQFVVEISQCAKEGYTTSWGKILKPSECKVQYIGTRHRIGSTKNQKDYWYDFENETFFGDIYKKRANEVIDNWDEAEKWWDATPLDVNNVA